MHQMPLRHVCLARRLDEINLTASVGELFSKPPFASGHFACVFVCICLFWAMHLGSFPSFESRHLSVLGFVSRHLSVLGFVLGHLSVCPGFRSEFCSLLLEGQSLLIHTYLLQHPGERKSNLSKAKRMKPPPRSIVVRASARGAGGRGLIPDRVTPKDVKTGRFALLSLALGINELGNRLGGSESV